MKIYKQNYSPLWSLFTLVLALSLLSSCSQSGSTSTVNEKIEPSAEASNHTPAIEVKPLAVFGSFIPSGWMGDGEDAQRRYLDLDEASATKPHSGSSCVKINYKKAGPERWAAIYWQNVPDNFCKSPGEDLSKEGFTKIVFWVRGDKGGELAEFKAGGIKNCENGGQYKDSFQTRTKRITLEKEWKKDSLDLRGMDLSSVIGGFCWSSPKPSTIYLDDVSFQ